MRKIAFRVGAGKGTRGTLLAGGAEIKRVSPISAREAGTVASRLWADVNLDPIVGADLLIANLHILDGNTKIRKSLCKFLLPRDGYSLSIL